MRVSFASSGRNAYSFSIAFTVVLQVFEWVPAELSEERKEAFSELAEVETSEKFLTFHCQGFVSSSIIEIIF